MLLINEVKCKRTVPNVAQYVMLLHGELPFNMRKDLNVRNADINLIILITIDK